MIFLSCNMISPIELRHSLHQNPEIMFEEFQTTQLLYDNLSKIQQLKIYRPLPTGLVVEYKVNDGKYLLFRADIDALPIKENTGWEWASKNDNMHACGHDVHTAVLYSFIQYVVENKIDRNIIFLFQPGEEAGGGAVKIIESGILDNFDIEYAFALHVTDEYDFGTVASTDGVLFVSSVECDIEIFGKSSHVAFPKNGINAFNTLRYFLDLIDKDVEQATEPFIFGYGKVLAGQARNIIPNYAKAECTVRALSLQKQEEYLDIIKNNLIKASEKFGAKFELNVGPKYAEVNINSSLYQKVMPLISQKFNFIDCGVKMTAEDFGYFAKRYLSFMAWLGISKGEKNGLHNDKFLPSDDSIELGRELFITILNAVK